MIAYDDGIVQCHQGDVLEVLQTLEPDSIDCVVTSPPYWGLRDYGTGEWVGGDVEHQHIGSGGRGIRGSDNRGNVSSDTFAAPNRGGDPMSCTCGAVCIDQQIGLEPTLAEYLEKMVAVFREVRRVLKPTGTLWLNMGDCYASSINGTRHTGGVGENHLHSGRVSDKSTLRGNGHVGGGPKLHDDRAFRDKPFSTVQGKLKPKDLVGQAWRLAFALQDDGWWLRSDIVWSKPNPMPESVTDRPTKAHEYVFLLTKSERYFYDAEAIQELASGAHARTAIDKAPSGWDLDLGSHGSIHRDGRRPPGVTPKSAPAGSGIKANDSMQAACVNLVNERNARSVWTIATQPYPDAHFATFPEELPRRCIEAGTSERGCCTECGKPWQREVDVEYRKNRPSAGDDPRSRGEDKQSRANGTSGYRGTNLLRDATTVGWKPSCDHLAAPSVPATVLDPFAGSGTTLAVAKRLDRRAVGIELNPEYQVFIKKRVSAEGAQMRFPMPA